ncbi:MAG: GHKL domain-containing protein [Bacilli bacterium]|nr:GHKL domain-containing protein [Bacilli bacterium]
MNYQKKNAVICLTFKNYYTGELLFRNGLPITKKNTDYHGYGFKSMHSLVNKYYGKMKISTDKDVFILEIFFSLHHNNKQD